MKLREIAKTEPQELFDRVVTHLRSQRCQAGAFTEGGCRYRADLSGFRVIRISDLKPLTHPTL